MKVFNMIRLAFSLQSSSLVVPGMGGTSLYNDRLEKIWPSLRTLWRPYELDISCTHDGCHPLYSRPLTIGNVSQHHSSILSDEWFLGSMYSSLLTTLDNPATLPYDFRLLLDPSYLSFLYAQIDAFLEKGPPRNVFCHSLGGLLFQDYLSEDPSRARHVKKLVFINVPFDGSIIPFLLLFPQKKRSSHLVFDSLRMITTIDRFGGLYWCLPWMDEDHPLFRVNSRLYTSSNVSSLFVPEIQSLYPTVLQKKKKRLQRPPVRDIHVIKSLSRDNTPVFYDFDTHRHTYTSGGDGVVPLDSLSPPFPCTSEVFPNTDHTTILNDPVFLRRCRELCL